MADAYISSECEDPHNIHFRILQFGSMLCSYFGGGAQSCAVIG